MKIGFVCTNYNNSSFTRNAVSSLSASDHRDNLHIVVVDNHSAEEDVASLTTIARDFPWVELVLNQENVGYFPGLNIGIEHLRSKFPDVEHLVVGNNDLEFPVEFLPTIKRNREVLDTWAVVAPNLVTPSGLHQNPHVLNQVSRIRKLIYDMYFLSYGSAMAIKFAAKVLKHYSLRDEYAPGNRLHLTAGQIQQGYGACYLLGPVFFRHFSRLCAPTFMMQEEYFLHQQLQLIGQSFWYEPRFVARHHGHATTSKLPRRLHWKYAQDSYRIYKKYLHMSPAKQRRFLSDWNLE